MIKDFIGELKITQVIFMLSYRLDLTVLLVLASFGMAMVEPTSEAYFFDILKKGDASRFYGPYNTRADVGGLLTRVLAIVSLLFLPFRFLFILFGIFMAIMAFFSFRMKDFIEKKD